MMRNLKALGLALVAVFAISAMTASAASAQQGELTTEFGEPVTLIGTETGGTAANALTSFDGKVECDHTTYTGHEIATTPHQPIPDGATSLTVTPTYEDCTTFSGGNEFPTHVDPTDCDYEFFVGQTTEATPEVQGYGVDVDIVCPEGQQIEVTQTSGGSTVCNLKVGSQTGIESDAHVINTEGHDLGAEGIFTNIHVEREGLCLFDGQGSTTNEGEFHLDVTLKDNDDVQGVTVTH